MLIYNEDLTKLYIGSYSESLHVKRACCAHRPCVRRLFDSFVKGQGGVYITGVNARECEGSELVEALRVHNNACVKQGSQPIDISYYQQSKPAQRMYSIDIAKIEVYSSKRNPDGLIISEARVAMDPHLLKVD